MKDEKVEVQLDETVFTTPFQFSFRPMKRYEGLFLWRGRMLAAFEEQRRAFEDRHGLISGPGAPFSMRGRGLLKRGAKWVKPDPLHGQK